MSALAGTFKGAVAFLLLPLSLVPLFLALPKLTNSGVANDSLLVRSLQEGSGNQSGSRAILRRAHARSYDGDRVEPRLLHLTPECDRASHRGRRDNSIR